jgi:hypothetical protein
VPYPPFPANDIFHPDLRNLLWPELRRVTQPPFIAGPLAFMRAPVLNDKLLNTR